MKTRQIEVTLTLTGEALERLNAMAVNTRSTHSQALSRLLNEVANSGSVECELINRLLSEAGSYFPPVMTLEEQSEFREEIIDYLCTRIDEINSKAKTRISPKKLAGLKERLRQQAKANWNP